MHEKIWYFDYTITDDWVSVPVSIYVRYLWVYFGVSGCQEVVAWVQDYAISANLYNLCRFLLAARSLPFHTSGGKSAVSEEQ